MHFNHAAQLDIRLRVPESKKDPNHRLARDGQRHRSLEQQHQACVLVEDFPNSAASADENVEAEQVEQTIASRRLEPITAEMICELPHNFNQICCQFRIFKLNFRNYL